MMGGHSLQVAQGAETKAGCEAESHAGRLRGQHV